MTKALFVAKTLLFEARSKAWRRDLGRSRYCLASLEELVGPEGCLISAHGNVRRQIDSQKPIEVLRSNGLTKK